MSPRIKFLAASTLIVLLLASLSVSAATQSERRIRFGRGQTRAVVRGVASGDYIFRARSGQTLVVNLAAGDDTVFALQSPMGTNMAGEGGTGRAEFQLTETGDYHISVINRDGKRRRFKLTLSIR
jgi:hypothetical protein